MSFLSSLYIQIIVVLFLIWTGVSIYFIVKLFNSKNPNDINQYLYDSIPTVFTTFGVLGTFLGIYSGLQEFDVNNITTGIPRLLEGLKASFSTSIWGLGLSLLFGKISQWVLGRAEKHTEEKTVDNHGNYLKAIAKTLEQNQKLFIQQFDKFSQLQEQQLQVAQSHIQLSQKTHNSLQNHSERQSDLLIKIGKLTSYIREEGEQRHKSLTERLIKLDKLLTQSDSVTLAEVIRQSFQRLSGLAEHLQDIRKEVKQHNELFFEELVRISQLLERNDPTALVELAQHSTQKLGGLAESLQGIRSESGQRHELLMRELLQLGERLDPTAVVELAQQSTQKLGGLAESLQGIRSESGQHYELLIKEIYKLGERLDPSVLVELTKQSTQQIAGLDANLQSIRAESNQRHELLTGKLVQIGKLLEKNDTDLLVEMMQRATETFNKQMSALVERLVQENFSALNNSVQQLNNWQQENKEMVAKLVAQFSHTVESFETGSQAITNITHQTERLVAHDSHLTLLIKELQKAMIADTHFSQMVEKINMTVNILRKNTIAFDETTNKLNYWVKNQMNFSDSVEKLLTRLEEIDRIKDINEIFWNETKKQMNEGVAIINRASESISGDLESINEEFYNYLNDLLINLDTLIRRMIEQYSTQDEETKTPYNR